MVNSSENNTPNKSRLFFLDNIKASMIILVVIVHIAVTYSGIGDWYYKESCKLDKISSLLFIFFQSHSQAFFLGLLFLISGYFTAQSYFSREKRQFILKRLSRLGIPLLLYVILVQPLILTLRLTFSSGLTVDSIKSIWIKYFFTGQFISGTGPLWFVFTLLIFTLIFVLFTKQKSIVPHQSNITLNIFNISLTIILITVCNFLVRLLFPFGTSVINLQFCFFSQYIVLFIGGILMFKYQLLEQITYKKGIFHFRLAIFAGMPLWIAIFILGGGLIGNLSPIFGGFTWQSLAYSFWESFFCINISIFLIGIYREKLNTVSAVWKFLSDNSFTVYVLHSILLVAFSLSISQIKWHPGLKFAAVTVIFIPLCFIFCSILKKFWMNILSYLQKQKI